MKPTTFTSAATAMAQIKDSLATACGNAASTICAFVATKMTGTGGQNVQEDIKTLLKGYPQDLQIEILTLALSQLANNPPITTPTTANTQTKPKKQGIRWG